jgi:ABC-type sulfate transport system permease subunit
MEFQGATAMIEIAKPDITANVIASSTTRTTVVPFNVAGGVFAALTVGNISYRHRQWPTDMYVPKKS